MAVLTKREGEASPVLLPSLAQPALEDSQSAFLSFSSAAGRPPQKVHSAHSSLEARVAIQALDVESLEQVLSLKGS